jgi:hypothetical protein
MGYTDVIAEKIFDSEFYDEIGTPAYIQNRKAQIAAWLETNIGHLNILINQSYRVDYKNDICPVLQKEEEAIFIQLYLKYYYKRQAQSILKSASSIIITPSTPNQTTTMSDWTELREGDSSIKRVSQTASPQQKVQMSQAYKSFSDGAEAKLKNLVHSYNMYKSSPRQVAGADAPESSGCFSGPESCPPTTPTTTPT